MIGYYVSTPPFFHSPKIGFRRHQNSISNVISIGCVPVPQSGTALAFRSIMKAKRIYPVKLGLNLKEYSVIQRAQQ
jgi:hypothetical protein